MFLKNYPFVHCFVLFSCVCSFLFLFCLVLIAQQDLKYCTFCLWFSLLQVLLCFQVCHFLYFLLRILKIIHRASFQLPADINTVRACKDTGCSLHSFLCSLETKTTITDFYFITKTGTFGGKKSLFCTLAIELTMRRLASITLQWFGLQVVDGGEIGSGKVVRTREYLYWC